MARRVLIRSRQLNTDVAQLEELVKSQYKEILKYHREDLEACAEWIEETAYELVPLDTSKLRDSISVRLSKSNRYPGIIATATAKDHGFDYALIQEENEDFEHTEMKVLTKRGKPVAVDSGRIAHYLGGPFAASIKDLFEDLGIKVKLPAELEHALDYYEENGFGGE